MARPAVHVDQEQIVHFDDLVEQRLASAGQIAGDEGIALRFGEAAQIAGIVAPAEFTDLTYDPRIEIVEAGPSLEQLFDQAKAHDVALDHAGIG
jgi:hypothetical protein